MVRQFAALHFPSCRARSKGTLRGYEQWNIDESSVVTFAAMSFVR